MSDIIPLKFRVMAGAINIFGAIFILPVVGFNIIYTIGMIRHSFWFPLDIIVATYFISLSAIVIFSIVNWILWKLTRRIHPFVARSGINATNNALNMLVVILCCAYVNITTCMGNNGGNFSLKSSILVHCVALAYAIDSLVVGIFMLRGYDFQNFLIYPFIKSK
jgi:hypothetical protein